MTAASGRLFRDGMLIKDGTALERLAEVDTVVFDKTGTLTLGKPEATNLDRHDARDLAVAAALAAGSSHPLAQALADAIGVAPAKVTEIREVPGFGVEGRFGGRTVRLGRASWVGAEAGADTAAWLRIGSDAPQEFPVADRLRPGVEKMVGALRDRGLRLCLISGDAEAPVADLAARLGIDTWHSGALPEDKAALIAGLARDGARVLMLGDGLNDTAALAGAHVSISPASALDAARTASDIVVLGHSLDPVVKALTLSHKAIGRIRENIAISNVYNVIAVPLAIAGLCTPLIAALAMSSSSISVSLNSMRLR